MTRYVAIVISQNHVRFMQDKGEQAAALRNRTPTLASMRRCIDAVNAHCNMTVAEDQDGLFVICIPKPPCPA